MPKKKKRNIASILLLGIVLLAVALYIIIDSGTYVATVAGYRIRTYEYKYNLYQQIKKIEQEEGLISKTEEEKAAFWTSTEGGRNPLEAAKNESLNASKAYMIQIIKAHEMGLSVNAGLKSEVEQYLDSVQQAKGLSDRQFPDYVKAQTGVSLNHFRKILENTYLIERFRQEYIKKYYTAPALTDEEIRAEYDKDPRAYDIVDFSYVVLGKLNADGSQISEEELAAKRMVAEEALKKIQAGEDINAVISQYSEQAVTAGEETSPGKGSVGYLTNDPDQPLYDYLFSHDIGDSNVVETDNYILVVKIDKRTGFEDVKGMMRNQLESADRNDWYSDQLEKWNLDPRYNIIKNERVYNPISYK